MRKGKVMLLEKHLADAVDVTVLEDQAFLQKEKAVDRVNTFFTTLSVKNYSVSHRGTSKGAKSLYTIGTLQTDKGNFEVYMYLSVEDGMHRIEEIKIEK